MSTDTNTDDLKAVRAALVAAQKVRATEQALRAEDARLAKEYRVLDHAYCSEDEAIEVLRREAFALRRLWVEHYGRGLLDSLTLRVEEQVEGPPRKVRPHLPDFCHDGRVSNGLLFGLLTDQMIDSLERALRDSGLKFGPPAAEKAAKLAEVAAQRAEVQRQHTALVDQAAEVGIVLEPLPAVKERRDAEARKRERQLELERARAASTPVVPAPTPGEWRPNEAQ